jgi:hypothetical protein
MVKTVSKVSDILLPLAKKAIEKFRKGGKLTIEEMGYIDRLFYYEQITMLSNRLTDRLDEGFGGVSDRLDQGFEKTLSRLDRL